MLLVLFLLGARAATGGLSVAVAPDGSFDVSVDGVSWLPSGPVGIQANGDWCTSADRSLVFKRMTHGDGSDSLGAFTSHTMDWETKQDGVPMTTSIRYYSAASAIIFEQTFPAGVKGTARGSDGDVVSAFPSFIVESGSVERGYAEFVGSFIDDSVRGPHVGQWNNNSAIPGGMTGGPLVLFSKERSLVMSSASNFMAASWHRTKNTLDSGVMGLVTEIPANYSVETIVYLDDGINAAFLGWGNLLLKKFGKTREGPEHDFTANHLTFNTDHGAYYYYHTEEGKNYLETLLDVYDYAKQENIPYRAVLLDSWWYFKGVRDGVKNWTAMPKIFPGGNPGIAELHDKTGWPIIAHNRYWSANTDYATQNGGKYDFIVESTVAMPVQEVFWDDLFESSKKWGLYTYEQDWLYNEIMDMKAPRENATLARDWLMQMGTSAATHGLNIQYCMPYPRHALQSVELPAVSQIRASNDYVPSAKESSQWHIGSSSMLAYSLALAPFKDNFWSTSVQKGAPSKGEEFAPALQAAVSTLSAGPVTPGDGIGFSDQKLIMRSCRTDGLLLKPSRPATAIDGSYLQQAGIGQGPEGQVWSTHSEVSGLRWYIVFAAEVRARYSLVPSDIHAEEATMKAYSVNFNTSAVEVASFSNEKPIDVKACDIKDFQVHYVAPSFSSGWTFLGELAKWVPVSPKRFTSVTSSSSGATVVISGVPKEVVVLSFQDPSGTTVDVTCIVDANGVATAKMPEKTCQ